MLTIIVFYLSDGTSIPPFPTKPAMPDSANKLTFALYNQRSKTWEAYCQDTEYIRNLVEPSLGQVVTMESTDEEPMYGLSKVTTAHIIRHVISTHSSMQINDIAALDKLCHTPCPDPAHFASPIAKQDSNFKRLAQSGIPRCDYGKVATLIKTVNHIPEIMNAANHYKDIVQPDASKQSYQSMTQTISTRLMMVAPRPTANPHASASDATLSPKDQYDLLKEISELKKAIAGLTLPGASPHPRYPRDTKQYCFVHGLGHKGTKYKLMLSKPDVC